MGSLEFVNVFQLVTVKLRRTNGCINGSSWTGHFNKMTLLRVHYSDIVSNISSGSMYETYIYICWHSTWHFFRHILWSGISSEILSVFYLAYILTFSLAFYLTYVPTFSLARVWVQAWPTAPRACNMMGDEDHSTGQGARERRRAWRVELLQPS